MVKILLNGALGRMGKMITDAADNVSCSVSAGVDVRAGSAEPRDDLFRSLSEVDRDFDVIVDFSRPEGLDDLLAFAVSRSKPVVLCTTGYTDEEISRIHEAAGKIAVFRSGNMSLGVNVLCHLVKEAAKKLGVNYDIEIIERHHNQKKDAPSGTAIMLRDAAIAGRGEELHEVDGRGGRDCKRDKYEIGMHAVRGGTVVGIHEVGFYGDSEVVTLTHTAESRGVFAAGAISAAKFIADKPAGMYDMDDLLAE